jgi:hypothetical protein
MTEGFLKLLAVSQDTIYEWNEYFVGGYTGKGIFSGRIMRENGGFMATPLDVAAGIRQSFPYTRMNWSDRCQILGLADTESKAAFDAIFSRVHEKDNIGGYLQMSIREYKEYLRSFVQLKKTFGGYDEYDSEAFMYALQSIGLGLRTLQIYKQHPVYKQRVYMTEGG